MAVPNINASDDNLSAPHTDQPADEGAIRRTDPQLLNLLVCPQTRTGLIWDAAASELISIQARLAYPVQEGVPRLLVEIARPLTDEEIAKWRKT